MFLYLSKDSVSVDEYYCYWFPEKAPSLDNILLHGRWQLYQCSLIPVSYTHLDVYKRQLVEWTGMEREREVESILIITELSKQLILLNYCLIHGSTWLLNLVTNYSNKLLSKYNLQLSKIFSCLKVRKCVQ